LTPLHAAAGDFDADGADDMLLADATGRLRILPGGGNGRLTSAGEPTNSTWIEPTLDVAAVELPGDDDLDAITVHDHAIQVWRGQGDGGFAAPLVVEQASLGATVGDFLSDPGEEIVIASDTATRIFALVEDDLVERASLDAFDSGTAHEIAAGDVDGDAGDDIVRLHPRTTGVLAIVWPSGDAMPGQPRLFMIPGAGLGPTSIADLDGDGHGELLVPHPGSPGFTAIFGSTVGFRCYWDYGADEKAFYEPVIGRIVADDFSGDGRSDLAFASDGSLNKVDQE
jgi:hypothetical protein